MLKLRKANERGHANHGWLDSYHTFSFGRYYDPQHLGFRDLRVINDDVIRGGAGFPTHGHADMEIISYVTEGALEHKDSMGSGSVIRPGDVQIMSAGSGIEHSEFNHLKEESTHLFQIWIHPEETGLTPSYAERHFDESSLANQLRPIVTTDGREGSLVIRQNASIYAGRLEAGTKLKQTLALDRHGWLQVLWGAVTINGESLASGDGVALSDESVLDIEATEAVEVLFFDLK